MSKHPSRTMRRGFNKLNFNKLQFHQPQLRMLQLPCDHHLWQVGYFNSRRSLECQQYNLEEDHMEHFMVVDLKITVKVMIIATETIITMEATQAEEAMEMEVQVMEAVITAEAIQAEEVGLEDHLEVMGLTPERGPGQWARWSISTRSCSTSR